MQAELEQTYPRLGTIYSLCSVYYPNIRQCSDVLNRRNFLKTGFYEGIKVALVDEVVDANFVDHTPPPGKVAGPEGVKQVTGIIRAAFSNYRLDVEELMAEGDVVMSLGTSRGTHLGDFLGIRATGKQVTFGESHLIRMADRKLAEVRELVDALVLFQQLGVIPPMGWFSNQT